MADTTTIEIRKDQWSDLNGLKEEPGESMKDVVDRLTDVFREVEEADVELEALAGDGPTPEEISAEHQTFEEVADETGRQEDAWTPEAAAAAADLPGQGEKQEARRNALTTVLRSLRDDGPSKAGELQEESYDSFDVQFVDAESWWKNAAGPALSELRDLGAVELVDQAAGLWAWAGEDDE